MNKQTAIDGRGSACRWSALEAILQSIDHADLTPSSVRRFYGLQHRRYEEGCPETPFSRSRTPVGASPAGAPTR